MDVPALVENFGFPVDFIILDMDDKIEVVILGRPFIATAGALIDVQGPKLTLKFGDQDVVFDMKHATDTPSMTRDCMTIDSVSSCINEVYPVDNEIPLEIESVNEFTEECHFVVYQITDDKRYLENLTPATGPEVDIKPLPTHLKYEYLGVEKQFPVILSLNCQKLKHKQW
jgi:hypothetical protein